MNIPGFLKWSLLSLFVLVACSDTEAQKQNFDITGRVLDAETQQALVGVPVYLLGTKSFSITKEEGRYSFQSIEPGRYQITVASQGYSPLNDSITVDNRDLKLDFTLTPKEGEEELTAAARNRKRAEKQERPPASDNFKTLCDCHEAGTEALDEAISLRKTFESADKMYENDDAVASLKQILEIWESEQEICLVKFGTQLLGETACNKPDEISLKKHTLRFLGVTL